MIVFRLSAAISMISVISVVHPKPRIPNSGTHIGIFIVTPVKAHIALIASHIVQLLGFVPEFVTSELPSAHKVCPQFTRGFPPIMRVCLQVVLCVKTLLSPQQHGHYSSQPLTEFVKSHPIRVCRPRYILQHRNMLW